MELTVMIDDQEFILPKKTLNLAKMIDKAYSAISSEESYKRQYIFVKEVLGSENAEKLLAGDKIDTIDLVMLSVAFVKIEKAYIAPVEESREDSSVDPALSAKLDKIVAVGEAIDKVAKIKDNR